MCSRKLRPKSIIKRGRESIKSCQKSTPNISKRKKIEIRLELASNLDLRLRTEANSELRPPQTYYPNLLQLRAFNLEIEHVLEPLRRYTPL